MGFHFGTGVACMCACLLALTAGAMPSAADFDKVRPVVESLSAGKSADKVQALATEAETEAGKFLLLEKAAALHVKAKDYDKAADALEALREAVPDIPASSFADLVKSVAKPIRRAKDAPRLQELLKTAQVQAKEEASAAAAKSRWAKDLAAAEKQLAAKPDAPALLRKVAELQAATDDWASALETFAKLGGKAARAVEDETEERNLAAAADFWWEFKPGNRELAPVFRAHAAQLYQTALDAGLLTGLWKARAEERLAEVGSAAAASAPSGNASSDALYLVVDLASGPKARKYRVAYLKNAPPKGWTKEHKTKKLVLRRIEPGSFIMGEDQKKESHRVTLTKPFYIGVFETTQKQWELVMGANPSDAKGETRPVEQVSWNMIRGDSSVHDWPAKKTVAVDSFVGRLRARTGLEFDLPTEAQWEYACRAGTTSKYNNGGDTEDDLRKVGRYRANQTERGFKESDADLAKHRPDRAGGFGARHTAVGSYLPNAWGLYDLHGNVWEWCRDWRGDPPTYGTDPVGAASGSARVLRGGSWGANADRCASSFRCDNRPPSYEGNGRGFRLSCSAGSSAK